MKISVLKLSHDGEQPIRVLKHNLIARLEQRNQKFINSLQSNLKLDKKIYYHAKNLCLDDQFPYIDSSGRINVHETFFSYMWIINYYCFVVHEEAIAIPEYQKRNINLDRAPAPELLPIAEEVFQYAKKIIRAFEPWDKENHPNPEYFDENTPEGFYILKTNDLFVESINFILYHEMAHAELEHIKKISKGNLTKDQRKALEIEADDRAIELIMRNCPSKEATEISIIIALAAVLFRKNNVSGGNLHPNLDTRIENAIHKINPTEENSIWVILCIMIKAWDKQFTMNLKEDPEYDTYKDLFYNYINQIKQ